MAHLLLLGPAREAAGRRRDDVEATTVGAVLSEATKRYGEKFTAIVALSQIWLNGAPTSLETAVGPHDEVAVLPPVSGG